MQMDIPISQIKPSYPPPLIPTQEAPAIQSTINALNLLPHPEGGYFSETDRDPRRIPNPHQPITSVTDTGADPETRSASSTIHYLLTPQRPLGVFHRNQSRTVHIWQRGRGRYVIIHADEVGGQNHMRGCSSENATARIETFVVGPGVEAGERMQWVVEGGKYKASFLLPDESEGETSSGLLISEVVVPGFEFTDHDFLRKSKMEELLTEEQVQDLSWMLKIE
ncbi:uncharacterized protein N7479_010617 [Penicillium vulpinum]|uniref:DUF985 domain-containing protein n=1 Tax=Penicillium vulpinum TaxID=29845 RepID=A0A1V6S9B4_9EURO|nr:uncharacterized protein N7479_010617 [Penicillium vulpinum]KAJ5952204.1 hypothetical protein N7479_010617 [Penicillium vulpinum]OQE10329.1 hypothetical protein PENVUL_c004G08355 [Penicillium vulpinum]